MNLNPIRITGSDTGNLNNYSLTDGYDFFSFSLGLAPVFTGFVGQVNGESRVVWIVNTGANDVTLAHQNANSSAANRIITTTGADYTLTAGTHPEVVQLVYDPFALRWRMRVGD
ncbi:MAG: hypothetical protein DWQ20_00735 [Actinobacteria bacterium]|nr:MAG: hypothetical protein DWQ20_00735 [Actinomycetota bacterium]